ncbi:GIY-YIG nuclease family protein [Patescibacteria group bacterium]|nr:GIY-YIG nuclease family protein [Patescibacteria group bacterium]
MAYLYILYSDVTRKYYIGSTNDLDRRLSEHNRGQTKSTKAGVPWNLAFVKVCEYPHARALEIKLKRKKSRKFIEQMILNQSITLS